jgi:hypothetical protein
MICLLVEADESAHSLYLCARDLKVIEGVQIEAVYGGYNGERPIRIRITRPEREEIIDQIKALPWVARVDLVRKRWW